MTRLLQLLRLSLLAFLLLAPPLAAQQPPSQPSPEAPKIRFERGPYTAKVTDRSTLQLPEGFVWLDAEEAKRLLRENGNFPDERVRGMILAPGKGWFIVVSYIDAGYIRDDDAKDWDPDEILNAIKSGTDEDNAKRRANGGPELAIIGWAEKPRYDAESHKVVWAIAHRGPGGEEVNYNTLTLGRYGYISMNLVTGLAALPEDRKAAETMLGNLSFDEGSRYADFSSATDKVAAVGLAALIAGAAAKAGLLAKLWAFILPAFLLFKKFIIFIVIGVGGAVWRFLKGRGRSTTSPPP